MKINNNKIAIMGVLAIAAIGNKEEIQKGKMKDEKNIIEEE